MNQIDRYLMKVHNLFENYQDECLAILKKYKPKSEVKKYTASVHNYIMSIAEPEDLKFYKDKPRGNVISCKYIASKIDDITECKVMVLRDIFKYQNTPKLHLIKTDNKDDTKSFIKGIEKKLTSLDIEIEIIELNTLNDLIDYKERYKDSLNPFIVLKPLGKLFEENIDIFKATLSELDNTRYRDIDCFLDMNTSTFMADCMLGYVPTTVAAVIEIFKEFQFIMKKYPHVFILGQSKHLGKPMADVIEYNKFSTFVADSRTSTHIKEALLFTSDIIISVTGSKDICKMFNKYPVSTNESLANRTIIDVGIVNDNGKLRGDIPNDIKAQYTLYNKVPGRVGLIDTSIVALRTVESYYTQLTLRGELIK